MTTLHHTLQRGVLVAVYLADLLEHRRKCQYTLSPRRIVELAEHYGYIRERLALSDPMAPPPYETLRMYTEAQFVPLSYGMRRVRVIQHATGHILNRVIALRPNVVLFVGCQSIPEDLLLTLKNARIEIVFVHTSLTIPNRLKPYVDVAIPAREYAQGATPEQLTGTPSLLDVLEREDEPACQHIQDILMATPSTVHDVCEALHNEQLQGKLSPWVSALLAALALLPRCKTGQTPDPLPRNVLFLRLAMQGVDVERVAIPVLHFLCDEGTLRFDGENYFPSAEVNDAARQVATTIVRDWDDATNETPPSSGDEAANRILAAFEIFQSTPEQLDAASARTMQQYLSCRLRRETPEEQHRQLERIGLDAVSAKKLERTLNAFLEGMTPSSDSRPKAAPEIQVKKAANG